MYNKGIKALQEGPENTGGPKMPLHKDMMVKLEFPQRLNVVDDRAMRYLPRAIHREWNQLKKRCILQTAELEGVEPTNPFETEVLDSGLGATGFGVCSTAFWSYFGPVFSHYTLIILFYNRNLYSLPLYVGHM